MVVAHASADHPEVETRANLSNGIADRLSQSDGPAARLQCSGIVAREPERVCPGRDSHCEPWLIPQALGEGHRLLHTSQYALTLSEGEVVRDA